MNEIDANSFGARLRQRPGLVLASVFAAYLAFDVATPRTFPDREGPLWAMFCGVMVFQPLVFGMWAGLASGSLLTRLPVAIACLMLLCVVPGIDRARFADLERRDFIATIVIGFAIFAAALLLFLAVRRLSRFRLTVPKHQPAQENDHVRFSTKYLLALITLYAVVLGITGQLKFQENPPPASFLGPNFVISILIAIGTTFSAAVLPTLAVPWFILLRRTSARAILFAVAFWIVVTALIIVYWEIKEDGSWLQVLGFLLMAQFGAALVGALTAVPLRLVGFRLVRSESVALLPPSGPGYSM